IHAQHAATNPDASGAGGRLRLDQVHHEDGNIIEFLDEQHAAGIARPHFTLVGRYNAASNADGGGRSLEEGDLFEIDLVEAAPSVTSATTYSVEGKEGVFTMGDNYETNRYILVAANHDEGDFALVVVDKKKNQVDGMAMRGGEGQLMKVQQLPGASIVVTEGTVPPSNWTCGVPDSAASPPVVDANRYLRKGHHHHEHEHGHEHEHAFYHHDFLAKLKSDLGIDANIEVGERRKLYPTDKFPQKWSYQVDFFIEVDKEIVENNGDTLPSNGGDSPPPKTRNYINDLVSAVSAIYEEEIDTHLNVVHILFESTKYDGITQSETSLDESLAKMIGDYGGSSWHCETSTCATNGVDLHHGFVFRSLGKPGNDAAGLARLGGLCDPQGGFGISTGVTGTSADIGTMFNDFTLFAHEVGHNFGAIHTHAMEPKVETCGIGNCPTGSDGVGTGTLMSYCSNCGGILAMGFTFGGSWQEGDRFNIDSWRRDPTIGSFNVDPERVPKGMWEFVRSQTCTATNKPVDEVVCESTADCNDGNVCTVDTCLAGQCTNDMKSNCCGNFVCEAGELASCSDCEAEPLVIDLPLGSPLSVVRGIRINLEAINDVVVQSLAVYAVDLQNPVVTTTVNVYRLTASGPFSSSDLTDQTKWTQIVTNYAVTNVPVQDLITINFAGVSIDAGETQAFYVHLDSAYMFVGPSSADPLISDDNLKVPAGTRGGDDEFGPSGTYPWIGAPQMLDCLIPPNSPR
ncbi:hypothetical protein ACHAXR_004898, partial [Thalassiosira sp. AJA248-18]